MPTPPKDTTRLVIRPPTELFEWLESQTPEKGSNAQQVAIMYLAWAKALKDCSLDPDSLRLKVEALESEKRGLEDRLSSKEERLEQYREEIARSIQRAEAQEKLIEELTRMLDRIIGKLEPEQITSLSDSERPKNSGDKQ